MNDSDVPHINNTKCPAPVIVLGWRVVKDTTCSLISFQRRLRLNADGYTEVL